MYLKILNNLRALLLLPLRRFLLVAVAPELEARAVVEA